MASADMRRPILAAVLALAGPAVAQDAPPEPPDPELLEFLGETAGLDQELVLFMESRAAKQALKDAGKEDPKEADDE
jgi:hypothetical protein